MERKAGLSNTFESIANLPDNWNGTICIDDIDEMNRLIQECFDIKDGENE